MQFKIYTLQQRGLRLYIQPDIAHGVWDDVKLGIKRSCKQCTMLCGVLINNMAHGPFRPLASGKNFLTMQDSAEDLSQRMSDTDFDSSIHYWTKWSWTLIRMATGLDPALNDRRRRTFRNFDTSRSYQFMSRLNQGIPAGDSRQYSHSAFWAGRRKNTPETEVLRWCCGCGKCARCSPRSLRVTMCLTMMIWQPSSMLDSCRWSSRSHILTSHGSPPQAVESEMPKAKKAREWYKGKAFQAFQGQKTIGKKQKIRARKRTSRNPKWTACVAKREMARTRS